MAPERRGIKFKDYLQLLPLMKMFPGLSVGELLDIKKQHPTCTTEKLISIVRAKLK